MWVVIPDRLLRQDMDKRKNWVLTGKIWAKKLELIIYLGQDAYVNRVMVRVLASLCGVTT